MKNIISVIVLVVTTSLAAADKPGTDPRLAQLVGRWEGKTTATIGGKTSTWKITSACERTAIGPGIQCTHVVVNGASKLEEVWLFGYDKATGPNPFDYAESARRLRAALSNYPGDVEFLYWLGWSFGEQGDMASLTEVFDEMAPVDPTAPILWEVRASGLLYLGDRRGAREAAIECRRLAPTQASCAFELRSVLTDDGRCNDLETVLRAWAIASPDNPRPLRSLAGLLVTQGRSIEAVRDLFVQSLRLTPEPERAATAAANEYVIASATGDLAGAERYLRANLEPWDAGAARDLADLLYETGRGDEARALAEKFFAMGETFLGTSDANLYNDHSGFMLGVLARSGAITRDELRTRRDTWVRDLDRHVGGIYKLGIWAQSYAVPARTADEAADAVAALPAKTAPYYFFDRVYGAIGRTFVLAGRHRDAVSYLERATKLCINRDARDFYWLGRMREGLGDPEAACRAYGELLTLWPDPKPRSVTVEQARERTVALGCKKS